jgi:hypothetical protein
MRWVKGLCALAVSVSNVINYNIHKYVLQV